MNQEANVDRTLTTIIISNFIFIIFMYKNIVVLCILKLKLPRNKTTPQKKTRKKGRNKGKYLAYPTKPFPGICFFLFCLTS